MELAALLNYRLSAKGLRGRVWFAEVGEAGSLVWRHLLGRFDWSPPRSDASDQLQSALQEDLDVGV